MKNADHRYQEADFQARFIGWFTANHCYVETFSDVGAVGADMDSLGLIGDRPVLIEIKPYLSPSRVTHAEQNPGSMERKLTSALRALRTPDSDVALALADRDPIATPLIIFAVDRLSADTQTALASMLADRASRWGLDWEIYSGRPSIRLADEGKGSASPREPIPVLVDRGQSRSIPSLKDLEASIEARGVGPIYQTLVGEMKKSGFSIHARTAGNINFGPKIDGRSQAMVGVYVNLSSAELGLCIGFWREGFEQRLGGPIIEADLPGIEADRAGFLNSNRWLRSDQEARDFWAALMGSNRPV